MFQLTGHEAKVRNYNAFAEFAGEERVLAGALSLEITAHSGMLDEFDSKLRPLLYRKPEHENEQPRADDDLTEIRRPQLGDLKWDEEFPGYTLSIGSLESIEPLTFSDVKLAAFKLSPQQGGVVKIIFRAVVHPTPEESGLLDDLIQDTIDVTLTPPTAVARTPDLVDQANAAGETVSTADAAAAAIAADEKRDELYDDAVRVVTEARKVSISSLQRVLKIGYSRAARLIGQMEAGGAVSAPDSDGERTILAKTEAAAA